VDLKDHYFVLCPPKSATSHPFQLKGDSICMKCKLLIDDIDKINLFHIDNVNAWITVEEIPNCNEMIIKSIIE